MGAKPPSKLTPPSFYRSKGGEEEGGPEVPPLQLERGGGGIPSGWVATRGTHLWVEGVSESGLEGGDPPPVGLQLEGGGCLRLGGSWRHPPPVGGGTRGTPLQLEGGGEAPEDPPLVGLQAEDLDAEEERSRGKCPLTPYEVGLMLRGLGFANDTYLYVASGEIYGGEATLQPLKKLFPNFYTKEVLAAQELKPFIPFSSRLAAIDYIVCYESDVFVTNNNGNMAKILAGHRRFVGHKRTIRPNAKKLSSLFKSRERMGWETFARKVQSAQRGFMGEPDVMRPGKGDFHEFPYSCICQRPQMDENDENSINFVGEKATVPEGLLKLEGSREYVKEKVRYPRLSKAAAAGKAFSGIAA
ncbi:hypothetical protein Taro_015490 [Colocasia esculenta]|uniref:O-fucosyltransferase family protein n=1 Tax=Colocasia esculenta TaxID=4460 RepID=A0A843ULE8_COLES|nr:hypothetical protein [Colocasia esculenta]